ncbi:hypothetical protein [Ideonella sp. YS5]|uniref:hypothetical protein n=1 Tax=Ideonella sp. YS5 TaxID=3453714 RepID=UPI003EEECCBE
MAHGLLRALSAAWALMAGCPVWAATPLAGVPTGTVLWFQNDDDTGIGITSQNFEPQFDAYDDEAADDFVVPPGEVWVVRKVQVTGTYFAGMGPAVSENLVFYRSEGGAPGRVVKAYTALPGKDETGWGWFVIVLPEPLKLKPGRYWLSVQVNMDFESSGQWGWESTGTLRGKAAMWRNPGDGFETGCVAFRPERDCVPVGQGPDHMFALIGTRKARP